MSLIQIGSTIVNLQSVEIVLTGHGGSKYNLVVNGNKDWTYESNSREGKALVEWLASNATVLVPHELTEESKPKAKTPQDHIQDAQRLLDIRQGRTV